MELPPWSSLQPSEHTGTLPVILAALVSSEDDNRQFRRYRLRMEVGVGQMPPELPSSLEMPSKDRFVKPRRLSQRAVVVRNLSLTGLYFITHLPEQQTRRVEIQIPLPGSIATLPGCIVRVDHPAQTESSAPETGYGCAVSFLQSQIAPSSRRALMEYLAKTPLTG